MIQLSRDGGWETQVAEFGYRKVPEPQGWGRVQVATVGLQHTIDACSGEKTSERESHRVGDRLIEFLEDLERLESPGPQLIRTSHGSEPDRPSPSGRPRTTEPRRSHPNASPPHAASIERHRTGRVGHCGPLFGTNVAESLGSHQAAATFVVYN